MSVRLREALAHPEVAGGPDVEAPQREHQEHLGGPSTDAPDLGELVDDLLVGPAPDTREVDVALLHMAGQVEAEAWLRQEQKFRARAA